jgi:hypothetical protein
MQQGTVSGQSVTDSHMVTTASCLSPKRLVKANASSSSFKISHGTKPSCSANKSGTFSCWLVNLPASGASSEPADRKSTA